ncbi:MAG: hypothetical protein Q7S11_02370 [bacterium]|nr:hypothetical protein [bacterium]
MKYCIALIVILGIIGIGIFGFFAMKHSADGVMSSNCPIASLPISVCSSGALSALSHSLSMYQAFTNGIVSSIVTQVLAVVFLLVVLTYILRIHLTPQLFILSRNFTAKLYRPQALTRWLSLLVNSPSLN